MRARDHGGERVGASGLLEREREQSALGELIDGAAAGGDDAAAPAVVSIEGPPGIGKSALLQVAVARARGRGMAVLQACGAVLERDYPLGIAGQLFGVSDLRTGRARIGPDGVPREGDFRWLEALRARLVRAAHGVPLLLVVDDAHWADAESLRFLAYVATRTRALGAILLVALRPQEPGTRQDLLAMVLRSALTLRPAPLGTASVARLLADHAVPRAGALAAEATRLTGGNPFLAHELARELKLRARRGERLTAATLERVAPDGLGRLALARLRSLAPDAARLAGALAILGGRAETATTAELAGLDQGRTLTLADLLSDAGLLARGRPLRFAHPLLCAAIYEELPRSQRERDHARAAALLAARPDADLDHVAAHLLACEPRGEPAVVERLLLASQRALGRGAPDAAAAYLWRALREPPPQSLVARLRAGLGEAELRRGDARTAAEQLERALACSVDPRERAQVAALLSQALMYLGRGGDRSAEALSTALAQLPDSERELGLALEARLGFSLLTNPCADAALFERSPRFTVPRRAPRTPAERLALASQACTESLRGCADEAARLAGLALGEGELLELESAEGPLFQLAAYVLVQTDRLMQAELVLSSAVEDARARRSVLGEAVARGLRATCRYRAGELAGALADARLTLTAARRGLRLGVRPAAAALVGALLARGEVAQAAHVLADAGLDGPLPKAATALALFEARGRMLAAAGEHALALRELRACGELERGLGIETPVLVSWRGYAALSHEALGEHRTALALADQELARARAFGAPLALGVALRCAGRVRSELFLLEEAVAVLERSGARLEHALALLDLGAARHRETGEREGCEPLQAALRLARACGARALAQRAEAQLLAIGARLPRRLRGGREELTPTELRVARLAAQGHSNRRIAQELALSVRTVETHLARCYRKLEIRGRDQLAAALRGVAGGASRARLPHQAAPHVR